MDQTHTKNKKTCNEEENRQAASDTDTSVLTDASGADNGRLWKVARKRQRSIQSASAFSSEDDINRRLMPAPNKRKERKKEFLASNQAEAELEVQALAQAAEESRAALKLLPIDTEDVRSATALKEQVIEDVGLILKVSAKSKNLKGTFQRALKDASASIKAAVEALHSRSSTNETKKLQADNVRLQNEIAELRKEVMELRKELDEARNANVSLCPRQPSPSREETIAAKLVQKTMDTESLTRSIMLQVGGMMNARLEALEGRLLPDKRLRPPLATDRSRSAAEQSQPEAKQKPAATTHGQQGRNKKKKDKGVAANPPPIRSDLPSHPAEPTPIEEGWSTVVRRGKRSKALPQPSNNVVSASSPAAIKTKSRPVKLHPPRSSAVVITLQPGAEEKGFTYAKILAKAKAEIDLSSCGITSIKFRTAATGARILEIPGTTSGDKADVLAKKIKESLDEGVAKVSRPMKHAEMRISGLDDSVTSEEIVTAVAQRGDCPEEAIKVGEIRSNSRGCGWIWVRCPVSAAKKIGEGRFLVGWVSAKVEMLQPRAMRCYRCLQIGHVRARCTAETDRSDECYRCGRTGHKAGTCDAAPNCSLCAEANKPADHRLGSKTCSPPRSKKGTRAVTSTSANNVPAATSSPPVQAGIEEAMVTS